MAWAVEAGQPAAQARQMAAWAGRHVQILKGLFINKTHIHF